MISLIDIGNTSIAVAISRTGEKIDQVYRINTEKSKSADEYAITLNQFLKEVDSAVISSVVPELNEVFKEYFNNQFNLTPIFLGMGVKTGLKITTDNPKEVGGDIISNAVAAISLYDKTILIVDLGTATTFTYIEDSNLKGVAIAPGLTTSRNALITKTSLLPQVELDMPLKLLGTNSTDSIKSGLMFGHASMIEGMIHRIRKHVNRPELKVLLTGGHAKLVLPLLTEPYALDEQLILKGLLSVYKRNILKK
ncbi:MAG: type III pantothenate kinase [Firmicutes bacterium]|nr:type III pantothenate kinase [Bacillota bacterium]